MIIFDFIRFGNERYEKRDMQIRVRQQFTKLQEMDKNIVPWNIINAAQSMDTVEDTIWNIVRPTIDHVTATSPSIKVLWES